jgi:DNA repair protein RadC
MNDSREKLMSRGVSSLDDAELFALLLGTGRRGRSAKAIATELLNQFGSTASILQAPWEELQRTNGVGAARFAIFQAVRELARRAASEPLRERAVFRQRDDVSQFLVAQLGGLNQEVFGILFLDSQHRLIRFETLFYGTLTQTSVYPREIAKRALQLNAAAVIAAHNHPSGAAEPSRADQLLTGNLRRSLALLDIHLLDHLVVASGRTTAVMALD